MKMKRLLSILLSLALIVGMLPGMALTAAAADFAFDDCISNVSLFPSGCLKSMDVKIVPIGHYGKAYGKIAIHPAAPED